MTTLQKIRDGTYYLIWVDRNERHQMSTQAVQFDDFSSSCMLVVRPVSGSAVELNLKTNPIKRALITGQTFSDIASVFVIHNCVGQKMEKTSSSLWSARLGTGTFKPSYDYGKSRISFVLIIDFKPIKTAPTKTGSEYVLSHLSQLWYKKTMSDVTFKVDDKSIATHALILASGSPVFAAMFQNDCKESRERVVEIVDFDSDVIKAMLKFLYTGRVLFTSVNVSNLLMAAEKYGIESLKRECAHHLIGKFTVTNAVDYLVLAHVNNVPNLRKAALDFMSKRAKSICSQPEWKSTIKNYPDLCFEAMQIMAKDNI